MAASDAEIDYLLANDMKRCRAEAEQYPWFNKMNEPRQAVILSMLFNLGRPRFVIQTWAALLVGDYTLLTTKCSTAGQSKSANAQMTWQMMLSEWYDG